MYVYCLQIMGRTTWPSLQITQCNATRCEKTKGDESHSARKTCQQRELHFQTDEWFL